MNDQHENCIECGKPSEKCRCRPIMEHGFRCFDEVFPARLTPEQIALILVYAKRANKKEGS